jgi:hypothetical protein
LLVLDNRPFPDLRHIVRDAADERIDVFAEWVGALLRAMVHACRNTTNATAVYTPLYVRVLLQISARHQPKTSDGRQWSPNYHAALYNLTDEAIRGAGRRALPLLFLWFFSIIFPSF